MLQSRRLREPRLTRVTGRLLQQKFGGAYGRIAVEPVPDDAIGERIGDSQQAHALVVCHPGTHNFGRLRQMAFLVEKSADSYNP